MIPLRTTYRVATHAADYRRCRALVREVLADESPLSYPTVMAERDGEVIGLLGSDTKQGAIIAAPLVVKGRSPIIAMRLIEAYDRVMRMSGVTAYHFHVGPGNDRWRESIEKMGMSPWHEDADGAWFRRSLAA